MAKKSTQADATPEVVASNEARFDSDLLARSKRFESFGLHKDILRAILTEKSYTIHDAECAVMAYLKSDAFKVEK